MQKKHFNFRTADVTSKKKHFNFRTKKNILIFARWERAQAKFDQSL